MFMYFKIISEEIFSIFMKSTVNINIINFPFVILRVLKGLFSRSLNLEEHY
jgi:hypothetical protein